jgi:hypothetical protein
MCLSWSYVSLVRVMLPWDLSLAHEVFKHLPCLLIRSSRQCTRHLLDVSITSKVVCDTLVLSSPVHLLLELSIIVVQFSSRVLEGLLLSSL